MNIVHKNIKSYLKGYVKVRLFAKGEITSRNGKLERFINLCTRKGITIEAAEMTEETMEFYMSLQDFFGTREFCKKCGCRLVVIEKCGLPFKYNKIKYFRGFFVGIILGIVLLKIMTLYIWDIQLTGNEKYEEKTIIKYLNTIQIHHGMKRNEIDCDAIETKIRNKFYDIAWVCAEISGTKLVIHIKEGTNLNKKEKNIKPCNLIASDTGVIDSIIVRSGTPMIKKGMKVKKGDILVQSKIELLNESGEYARDEYLHADADVKAIVTYKYRSCTNRQYKKRIYTGKKRTDYFITWKKGSFKLKGITKLKEEIDEKKEQKHLVLLRNLQTPVSFGKSIYQEYIEEKMFYTREELEKEEKKKLKIFLQKLEKKGIQIIEKNVTINVDSKKGYSHGTIKGRKSIAIEHEIMKSNETQTSENKEG